MVPITQKTSNLFFVIAALIAATLACDVREIVADSDIKLSSVERSNSTTDQDINAGNEINSRFVEQCLASPDMYKVEFANINDDFSNESKKVCQGDFIITNQSLETLSLRYYNISDNGAMHNEGWTYLYSSVESWKSTERYFGSQKWTDGKSTIDTFTKLIVVRSSAECNNLISDENIAIWEEYTIPLIDPCR